MNNIYSIVLIVFFFSLGFSQQKQDSIPIPHDISSKINLRTFDEDLNKKYNGEAFDYSSVEGEAQNLLSRFLNWLGNTISNTFGFKISPRVLKLIEVIIYILMGVLALYLLIKFLVGENLTAIFSKKSKQLMEFNLSEEHIEHIDIDALIKDALSQKNYRLAIRYNYLKTLKNLSMENIIEWQYEKTNSDYQNEITNTHLKPLFQEISYLYDHIWYGEQKIDESIFKRALVPFEKIKNNLRK